MIHLKSILLTALIFSWTHKVLSLTLQECFESARKTNPRFEILELDQKQERIRKAIAVLDLLPKVELQRLIEQSPDKKVSNQAIQPKKGNIIAAVGHFSLAQTTSIAAQSAVSDANKYKAIEENQKLLTEGIDLYLEVCTNQQLLEVCSSLLEFTKNRLKLVNSKFNMGHATKTELINAQAELTKAECEKDVQESKLKHSKALFVQFFGITPTSDMAKPEDPEELPESLEKFLELALNNNPSLKYSRCAKKAKSAEFAGTIAERMPYISYETSKNVSHSDQKLQSRVSISIPLVAGNGKSILDIPLKKREVRKSTIIAMHAEDHLKMQVLTCWSDYDLKSSQLEMYKKFAQARSLALEATTQEYILGKGSLMAIYKAEQDLKEVKKHQLESESEFIKTKYRILTLCGNLSSCINNNPSKKKILKTKKVSKNLPNYELKNKPVV